MVVILTGDTRTDILREAERLIGILNDDASRGTTLATMDAVVLAAGGWPNIVSLSRILDDMPRLMALPMPREPKTYVPKFRLRLPKARVVDVRGDIRMRRGSRRTLPLRRGRRDF